MTINVSCRLTLTVDVFQATQQVFALSQAPSPLGDVQVFVDGLLMLSGTDYTLVGQALTFTGQTIGPAPVIQVRYWAAGIFDTAE